MADLKIALTCADYARVMPLATGAVKPKGIALTMVLGHAGSWPKRAEMLSRAVRDPDVQGGEWSCAQHLYAVDRGDRTHVGLPVFPLRNFTARDIYVRKGGPIRTPADLKGKRVGSYSYTASGSVWYRHFLRHIGVAPEELHWCIGSPDAPWSAAMDQKLPAGVTQPPNGKSLSDLLVAGELDAMLSPPRPERYHPVDGPIARLFPDFRSVEEQYFKSTGAFPPQHLIVIRRALWEKEPWIAKSLTDAFAECEAVFNASIRGFPYATPWMEEDLEKATALMGNDFHPVGFAANKAQMEMFAGEAHRMGFTGKRVTAEDYFQEFLAG
jgi:4,5-dihydroxyphthalate decarboxylase